MQLLIELDETQLPMDSEHVRRAIEQSVRLSIIYALHMAAGTAALPYHERRKAGAAHSKLAKEIVKFVTIIGGGE